MKFGIITLVSDNYGNKYQNYAVEQLLSEYGDVETFPLTNLYRDTPSTQRSLFSKINPYYIREVLIYRAMYQYDINSVYCGILHNVIYIKKHQKELLTLRENRSKRFKAFSDRYLHISDRVLKRENTFNVWTDCFDYFICGSDQIWNPTYATTSELAFCSFAPEKTICLSPSFGVSEIPEHRKADYSQWLNQIKTLSVREEAGQKIIKDLTGRDSVVLLDPTMALPVEKWEQMCTAPKAKLPEHYIVCYFLGQIDKEYKRRIDAFSSKAELPVVRLFDITEPNYYVFNPSEVLYAVKKADYVLTDSFHGTVFSILFHKHFYVFNRKEGGASMNSRVETLLRKFSLEKYLDSEAQFIEEPQWNNIEIVLSIERKKIRLFLSNSIQ